MADVTISSLPLGTPSGSALLPYSQGGSTLAVAPSALLQNVGNIGIGTANPNGTLCVVRNGGNGIILQTSATTPNTSIILSVNYNNTGRAALAASSDGTARPGLSLVTGDAERLTVDSLGNVSIPGNLSNIGVVKAWVNWRGNAYNAQNECTINASYNISKVVRDGDGKYTVFFSTPSPVTNQYYVTQGGALGIEGAGTRWLTFGSPYFNHLGKSTASFVCECSYALTSLQDAAEAWVSVIGV